MGVGLTEGSFDVSVSRVMRTEMLGRVSASKVPVDAS
jgi:hypothetical protein